MPRTNSQPRFARTMLAWLLASLTLLLGTERPGIAQAAGPGDGGVDGKAAQAALPSINKLDPPQDVARGTRMTLSGTNLPSDVSKIQIKLGEFELGPPLSAKAEEILFAVPEQAKLDDKLVPLPLGLPLLIRVTLTLDDKTAANGTRVPFDAGYLRLVSDTRPPLKLSFASPAIVSPDVNKILLVGEGLSGRPADYTLLFDGAEVPSCETPNECTGPRLEFSSPYQVAITGPHQSDPGHPWRGVHKLGLRSGNVTSEVSADFIGYAPTEIKQLSALVSGLLLVLVYVIAIFGGGTHEINPPGSRARKVYAFLIDPQTDTYSLSKLQFYAWTATALFGYCYLTLARTLAQGRLDILDVPENLPGILAISAGTTVASMGITLGRGSKGAGNVQPGFSDLLGTGGVVAPERVQFLLWTLVAIGAFLLCVFSSEPTRINDLPAIPSRLLLLSGVSAAGYLGGKLARTPGPIIDEIMAKVGSVQFSIMGHNLAADAVVEIEDTSVAQFLDATLHPDHRANATDIVGSAELAKTLELKLVSAPPQWLKDTLKFTVTNPDGQQATWPLAVDADLKAALTKLTEVAPTIAAPIPPVPQGKPSPGIG